MDIDILDDEFHIAEEGKGKAGASETIFEWLCEPDPSVRPWRLGVATTDTNGKRWFAVLERYEHHSYDGDDVYVIWPPSECDGSDDMPNRTNRDKCTCCAEPYEAASELVEALLCRGNT